MSKIKSLELRGVRSFSPNEPQTIAFYTPLTIILGKNGSGKTTLIESLKYATTGELPPNSKNGAFINDPKLTSSTKVKAQVRLTFYNIMGKRMQTVRALELTQTKTSRTQKTVQGTLIMMDPNSKKEMSVTNKCNVLDEELPIQLGVSKPILEYVIFCHQEESFWPLSEPAVLKKRFDEIFSATKYTKTIENIKNLRKEKTATLKLLQNELEHLKSNYKKSERIEKQQREIQQAIVNAELRIASLDGGEIEKVLEQMNSVLDENQKRQNLVSKCETQRLQLGMIEKDLERIQVDLEIYTESDQELQLLMKNYISSIENQNEIMKKLQDEKQSYQDQMTLKESELSQQLQLYGQCQSDVQAHEQRLKKLQNMTITIHEKHFQNSSHSMSGNIIRDCEFVSQGLLSQKEKTSQQFDQWKISMKEQEHSILDSLQELKASISSLEEIKRVQQKQIETNQEKIQLLQDRLKSIHVSEASKTELELRLKSEQESLTSFSNQFIPLDLENNLRKLTAELQSHEFQLTSIQEEMGSVNMQSEVLVKLQMKRREFDDIHKKIFNLFSSYPSLQNYKDNAQLKAVETKLNGMKREKENELTKCKEAHQAKMGQFNVVDTQWKYMKSELERLITQKKEIGQKLQSQCGSEDIPSLVKQSEDELEQSKNELSSLESASGMYEKFIAKFESTKCCPLCTRGYDNEAEEVQFLQRLQKILSRVPEKKSETLKFVESAETQRKDLKEIEIEWQNMQRLQDVEIPKMQAKCLALQHEHEQFKSELEDRSTECTVIETELRDISEQLETTQQLSQLQRQMSEIEKETLALQSELKMGGSLKTIQELQSEQEDVQGKCQEIRTKIDKINKTLRDSHKDLALKESRVRDIRDRQRQMEIEWNERETICESIAQLTKELENIENDGKCRELKAQESLPSIQLKEEELNEFRQEMACQEAEKLNEINQIQYIIHELTSLKEQVMPYIEKNEANRLKTIQDSIRILETEITSFKEKSHQIQLEIEQNQKKFSNIQLIQRTIDDNMKFRQLQRDQKTFKLSIEEFECQINDMDSASLESKYRKLKQSHERLVGERAECVGELKQLQEQAKRCALELNTEYKDIKQEYKKQIVLVKTETMVNDDFEKYAKALDRAIVKYHSEKLAEINHILKELWMKTYRGNDIEAIEIRSDVETTRGNRSYNYRVVMTKNNTELDMRGRCSAGQKVLACILIRLALAETFCLNCGILALDEPTTNLDAANMESLAESLAGIIETRKDQANFQLIVITHDDKFIEMLSRSDHADYVWRVSKNEEGFSTLTKELVHGMHENY